MDVKYLGALVAEAEKFVLNNDRAKYKPYFETAEKFCAEKGVVIGGLNGIELLLGHEVSKDSFFWELYCADTFAIAKELVETLYATKAIHVDSRTLNLQTNIKNREMTIMVDARYLFKIYSLDTYRGVSLSSVMGSVQVDGWFGNKVNVFPPAIVLISLYQSLYAPSKCGQWESLMTAERDVYKKFIAEEGTTKDAEGGFDRSVADDILLHSLLKDSRVVLIGDYAASKYGVGAGSRIQILTDIPPDELAAMTSRVLSNEKNQLRRVKVTHTRTAHARFNLNIPSDFQILKHTMYAVVGGEQIPLFDMFNSPEYEMIPYITVDKIRVATPYVLLRFLFIDIWIVKLIIGIEQVKSEDNKKEAGLRMRIKALSKLTTLLREYIESKLTTPFSIFPIADYIGVNTSETVAKKKLIANVGYKLPNIYPALNN